MLKALKNKLEILLVQCQERQGEIEKQISEYRSTKKPLVGKSRTSGYICGQPYFKDEDLYPGPHNDDYLYRKNVRKEFFPLDMFEVTDTNWTIKDKVNILKGVKTQIIEFISVENRLKIKKIGNGLEAERLRREIVSLKGKEIGVLWEKVELFPKEYPSQKFEIDWMRISNVNISGRHSVAACIGIWNNYMIPGLVRSSWNHNEEKQLLAATEKYHRQNWIEIAKEVPGRSPYQCFVHYQTTFSDLAQIKHERWTEEEDELLVKLVDENRIGSNIVWNKVVEKMPLRNKIQCYNRYMFTLMRPTKNTKFTPEEDCIITAYVQECGDEFRFIPPNLLPGRTNRQIWARYNHTLKYVNKHSGWTIEEDYRLINFIRENLTEEGPRKISWAACSKALGNHSRLSCRTRYYTIEKFLEKNPDATLDDVPRKEKRLSTKVNNENWKKTMVDIQTESTSREAEDQELPSTSSAPKKERKVRKKRDPLFKNRHFSDTIKCLFRKRFFAKFKHSFHYKFGDQFPPKENLKIYCINKAIFHLLHCTTSFERVNDYSELFTIDEIKFIRASLSMRLNPGLINYLQSARYCFLFPPNYNTILGLRGIVLSATYPEEAMTEETNETLVPNETDYQYALENFRNRFRMVFFWTMLLVKQNPNDADLHKSENWVKTNEELEKQISLQQLSKLHNSARLRPLEGCEKDVQIETKHVQVASKTGISEEAEQINVHSSTKPNRKSRAPRRLPKAQAIPMKDITAESTVEQLSKSTEDIPHSSLETLSASSMNLLTSQLVPYQLHYSIIPDQIEYYGASSSTTVPPAPIYQTLPYTLTSSEQAAKPPDQMSLVAQITIINPEDLPVAQLHQEPVLVEASKPATPEPVVLQSRESTDSRENTTDADQAYDEVHSVDSNHSDNVNVLGQIPEAEQAQDATQESKFTSKGQDESILTALPSESTTELESDIESDVSVATSVNDFVIEEIDEAVSQSSSKHGSPNPEPEKLEPESASLRTQTLADATRCSSPETGLAEADSDSKVKKTHGLCNSSVSGSANEGTVPDSSAVVSVARVDAKENDPCVSGRNTSSITPIYSNNLELDIKVIHAPKKTYNRSSKRRNAPVEVTKLTPHAWRWIHLEKATPNEIELHQDVWEQCNPERLKFNPKPNIADSQQKNVQDCDDIIVIDDDEVQIKEEPVEYEDKEDASVADETVSDRGNVDESCIQQIIQTASNILRMSRTYNMMSPDSGRAFREHPPSSPTMKSEPGQTSSRIFDEHTNCYYFVDEIPEETMKDVEAPIIDIPQISHTSHDTGQQSLELTFPGNPDNDYSQSISALHVQHVQQSNFKPLMTFGKQSNNSLDPSSGGKFVKGRDFQRQCTTVTERQPETTKIAKPKRPPREQRVENSGGVQKKALTLLGALYKQPRLTPPSTSVIDMKPLPSATSVTEHKSESRKRLQSPELSLCGRDSKRSKLCDEDDFQLGDGKEEQYSGFLEQLDESCDAVDIISFLSSMRQNSASQVCEDDDSGDESCNARQAVGCNAPKSYHRNDQSKHPLIVQKKISSPVSSTVTQQKVQTIVQSTTGHSAMDVEFKVAGVTIKKVRRK
ncbi:uncharacterized protein LOC129779038 isoform X2 [Toxorhynchites rutilus septentrionalis]|nr:uncharacterized protein LOC129779038 isoform X2 [Toxorhynchites rutilus septentrionalis]